MNIEDITTEEIRRDIQQTTLERDEYLIEAEAYRMIAEVASGDKRRMAIFRCSAATMHARKCDELIAFLRDELGEREVSAL